MLLGCIADDLTGASDLGVTLAREGLSVVQVNGVPEPALALPPMDCIVVALKSRTNPPEEAVAWSRASLAWLRARGAERIYFKYCSTFDSTPRGNIGPVADALLDALGGRFTVATPAYPRNGRTVYQGQLFVNGVPLAESGMRQHPLTPMTDSNLVRVLQAQTRGKVGLVPYEAIEEGAAALRRKMEELESSGVRFAILDATKDEHLVAAGAACRDMALTSGGAGLAMGLAKALGPRGAERFSLPRIDGPAAIFAGSCSEATRAQVAAASERMPALKLDARRLDAKGALDWAAARLGSDPVLIYASAPPAEVDQRNAAAVEEAFRFLARGLAERGVRRFVVAGGETSGAVVEALGVRALAIGPEIDPGVPWSAAVGGEPYLLALKSGNFGSRDFFARALAALA
jgi:3-dehydrotetronate 4-kinase